MIRRVLTRRQLLRLGLAAPLAKLIACDKVGKEIHIGSGYRPTPEQPLTPVEDFYLVANFGIPLAPTEAEWRLPMRGMVGRPATLARADLDRFAPVTLEMTMECIGNYPGGGLISSAAFTGVRLADVIEAAGPSSHARGVHLEGEEGYFAYLPLEAATGELPMLVHTMNGRPLTEDHGAPVRALFPGKHGMFSVKWLRGVTLAREWGAWGSLTAISNVVEGVTPVMSRIDRPRDGDEVTAGQPLEVSGIALTAGRGVARVEVDTGGGWRDTEIVFDRSPQLWSLWRTSWTPDRPGEATLAVRAFDGDGTTQSFEPRFPYDSGAIHTLRVVVR